MNEFTSQLKRADALAWFRSLQPHEKESTVQFWQRSTEDSRGDWTYEMIVASGQCIEKMYSELQIS